MTLSKLKNRKPLTQEEAEAGELPVPFLKSEWKAVHLATKAYQRELDWKKFQYFLQRVERSQSKRINIPHNYTEESDPNRN